MQETATPAVRRLNLPELSDQQVGDYLIALAEQIDDMRLVEHSIKLEIERRLRENGAKALVHPEFEKIELEDQWSPYVADYAVLNAAAKLLRGAGKDEEAVKIVKHIPQHAEIIEAHDEYGNPRSIHALIAKYGEGSEVGKLLSKGLTRQPLGPKLVIKKRAVIA